uniref:Uncharacterized protein n=1 Tax=Octopus bimaculoides TaxID=37653 RepID=A0A0L8GXQ4_OCTBM
MARHKDLRSEFALSQMDPLCNQTSSIHLKNWFYFTSNYLHLFSCQYKQFL